jgi:hypothetical protein
MRESRETRLAETEALFRDLNEGIATVARRFEAEETEFVCECGDGACTERVVAPLAEYERVRGRSTHFLLVPGHMAVHLERIVRRGPGYWVIEKVEERMRRIVKRLDPRAQTGS